MKVCLVVHDYLPEHIGGTEVHAHQLGRVLAARGHEVVALCTERVLGRPPGHAIERRLDGLRVVECSHPREYADVEDSWVESAALEVFRAFMERERPDVVHFQHLNTWGAACLELARDLGAAVLLTLHDYHLICGRNNLLDDRGKICDPGKLERCSDCLDRHPFNAERWNAMEEAERMRCAMRERLDFHRRCLQAAQRVIVPSYWLAEAMLAEGMVVPDQLVHMEVGYPGPVREPRPPRDGMPLRVGYIGGLYPSKGVTVLMAAMRLLGGEPIELAIHGPLAWFPDYVAELRSMAEGYPVRFRGRFEPSRIDQVLEDIDVLVVPSVWPENKPLTIHEAWRNGVPVVATDLGGMAECVTHGVNGLLFPRGDARALADLLRGLEKDRAFVTRLAHGRPELVTVEGVAERLEGIYETCLETVARCEGV